MFWQTLIVDCYLLMRDWQRCLRLLLGRIIICFTISSSILLRYLFLLSIYTNELLLRLTSSSLKLVFVIALINVILLVNHTNLLFFIGIQISIIEEFLITIINFIMIIIITLYIRNIVAIFNILKIILLILFLIRRISRIDIAYIFYQHLFLLLI